MTDLLAIFGLLAAVSLVLHVVIGAIAYRQAQQIRHLGAVCTALAKAVKHKTGMDIRVDGAFLGEVDDGAVDPDLEDVSQMPSSLTPWGVLEKPVE